MTLAVVQPNRLDYTKIWDFSSSTLRVPTVPLVANDAASKAYADTKLDSTGFDAAFTAALATRTSDNIVEGTVHLFYTDARFNTDFAGKTTTDLAEGTNLYYTQTRFDTAFDAKNTDFLDEGVANLYYTNTRVENQVSTFLVAGANITLTYDGTAHSLTIDASGGGTVGAFVDLTDVPSSYTGEGGKAVVVNAGESGLEFVDKSVFLTGYSHSSLADLNWSSSGHTIDSDLAVGAYSILFNEISTPASPSADQILLYALDDTGTTKLATVDSDGLVTILGSGGGGGGVWGTITGIVSDQTDLISYLDAGYLNLDQTAIQTIINGVPLMTTAVDIYGSGDQLVNMDYVREGTWLMPPIIEWYDPTAGLPVGPSVGDRYGADATANGWTIDYIYEWDGSVWVEYPPEEGWMIWDLWAMMFWVFFSGGWMEEGSDSYLKLDQSTPQTITGGMPVFDGGLESNDSIFINSSGILQLLGGAGYVEVTNDGTNAYMIKSAGSDFSQLSFGLNTVTGYTYIQSNADGSGTALPITFWNDSSEIMRMNQDGSMQMNAYNTDGFVKFTGSNGTIGVDINTYLTAEVDPAYAAWIAGPPNISEFTNDEGYLTVEIDPVFLAWLGTPPNISTFANDLGYLLTADLDTGARAALSCTVVGIDYDSGTGVFSDNVAYGIPALTSQGEWDDAYTHSQIIAGNPHGTTVGDIGAVATTGDETIDGIKTFAHFPITPSSSPTSDYQVANKAYVDTWLSGFDLKENVKYATTTALPASTYDNGTLGVGATLIADANGVIPTQDGQTPAPNDRVLIKDQADSFENGIYKVTDIGADDPGGSPWILTRTTDFDEAAECHQGSFMFSILGTVNGALQFAQYNTEPIVMGTTDLLFTQISKPPVYTASLGVTLTGNDFRLNLDTNPGLELNGNSVRVKVDSTTITRGAGGISVGTVPWASTSKVGSIIDDIGDVTAPAPVKDQVLKWNGTAWVNAVYNASFTFAIATFTCSAGATATVFEAGTSAATWKAISAITFSATYTNGPATGGYVSHTGWANLTMTGAGYIGPTANATAVTYPTVGSTKTFTLTATDGSVSPTNTITYYFYNKRFWGVSTVASSYTEANVEGLANSELSNSKAKTFSVTPGATEYIIYSYPKRLGTTTFTVGGFEGGFQSPETLSITNASGLTEDYYVYRSTNTNLGLTTVTTS